MTSFHAIAPFYDELMASVPYETWADYYELLLITQEVHPETVLEACCGTGTVSEILATRGYAMTGFDLSAPMIDRAREKALLKALNIDYHVADATVVELGQRFDAAFAFFDSLNYITSLEGFRRAVQHIGNHVRPGGSLIFDLNTAYAFEANLFTQKEQRKKATVQYDWKGNYDPDTRIIRVEMDFWRDGVASHETHIQRAHSDEEVRQALVDAGFERITVYESYSLDRPRKKSDRVHWCAIKRP